MYEKRIHDTEDYQAYALPPLTHTQHPSPSKQLGAIRLQERYRPRTPDFVRTTVAPPQPEPLHHGRSTLTAGGEFEEPIDCNGIRDSYVGMADAGRTERQGWRTCPW